MIDDMYKSPIFAGVMYIITVIVVIMYIIHKLKQKRLFTIYNISFIYNDCYISNYYSFSIP